MPRPIQSPGPADQLVRRYAVKGGLVLRLDETVVPVEPILPLPRKFAMGAADVPAGGAGFRTQAILINPLPFGPELADTSIQVHRIWATIRSATGVIELIRPAGAITGITNLTTDSFMKLPLGSSPGGAWGEKNTAAAESGVKFAVRRALTDVEVDFDLRDDPIVLDTPIASNSGLIIRTGNDNQAMDVTIIWSEPPDPA